jgi:metal-responsive CopG/Arc/MetJ family transcriptional regulator
MKQNMIPILLRIPKETLGHLNEASRIKSTKRSELIRECISNYIKYFNEIEKQKLIEIHNSKKAWLTDYYRK